MTSPTPSPIPSRSASPTASLIASPPADPPAASGAATGWQARLELAFERRDGVTVLAVNRHHGPLLVQRPFYPEGEVCHVYIVHPPGGVVAGDQLELDVRVADGAHALLTTPAAGKFYRSGGPGAGLRQRFAVDGGSLEWLPQENIFYPGARVDLQTTVQLRGAARFISWEIGTFGLGARDAPFHAGIVRQGVDLQVDGQWRYASRQPIDRAVIDAAWGLAGQPAVGTLLAYPAGADELDQARAVLAPDLTLGASVVDGVLVCRAIGPRADRLRAAFTAIWRAVRPRINGRAAVAPRVWAT